jgi:hypothetical protein
MCVFTVMRHEILTSVSQCRSLHCSHLKSVVGKIKNTFQHTYKKQVLHGVSKAASTEDVISYIINDALWINEVIYKNP